MHIFSYFVTLIINIESVFLSSYMFDIWTALKGQTQQYMQLFTLCFLYIQKHLQQSVVSQIALTPLLLHGHFITY